MANQFIKFNIKVPKKEVLETLRVLEQRGKSNKAIDESRPARLPGKRVSKTGKIYWESRKNRSDAPGKRV